MKLDSVYLVIILGTLALSFGCDQKPPAAPVAAPNANPYGGYPPAEFRDEVQTNREVGADDLDLTFVDTTGQSVALRDYRGKKNVVLVFTRGFSGVICPYCTTQTSRLISNYDEFSQREAEVLLVYPGARDKVDDFVSASKSQSSKPTDKVPFPILLDEDSKAVERLGIRASLASPSTFILDKEGKVRFAYVGGTDSDRPSIKAMLGQLDALK